MNKYQKYMSAMRTGHLSRLIRLISVSRLRLSAALCLAVTVVLLLGCFSAEPSLLDSGKPYADDYRKVPLSMGGSEAPLLRVVLPYEKRLPRAASPFGPGMDEELLEQFLAGNKYEVRLYYARTYVEAMDLLKDKRGDLAIGFGGELSAARSEYLAQSRAYASVYPVLVKDAGSAEHVYSNISHGGLSSQIAPVNQLLDPHTYSVLAPQHPDLLIQGNLNESVAYRWFWSADNRELGERLEAFWADESREDSLAELRERYHGFMPRKSRQNDLRELAGVISEKMEQYNGAIMKAAEETGMDPLLIAAVIFQESRFDPQARSSTGVRGIMQLTTSTANMLNVDRLDPEQCILGGARYLSDLRRSLEDLDISEWDRWCLALAAYNQGPANLRKALRLADAEGKGKSWAEMRGLYAKLAVSGTAGKNFRHKEALSYVESVRYYYYVMSRLAVVAELENKNLAPLLGLTAAS
ncbi:MAG: transglycosylase SLT domain-containing protein [Deltaproteobacteria bacterium]|nr:transglycosylase SLT domain-containing protein [Deltaproteobacteria bacterium]